mmetsp:Transcript_51418/g.89715  ORF Transcript_51418/g.89715 Transcript_51418/m.89715 type:complete len:275 (-) Transcript_51418:324-1148(-)
MVAHRPVPFDQLVDEGAVVRLGHILTRQAAGLEVAFTEHHAERAGVPLPPSTPHDLHLLGALFGQKGLNYVDAAALIQLAVVVREVRAAAIGGDEQGDAAFLNRPRDDSVPVRAARVLDQLQRRTHVILEAVAVPEVLQGDFLLEKHKHGSTLAVPVTDSAVHFICDVLEIVHCVAHNHVHAQFALEHWYLSVVGGVRRGHDGSLRDLVLSVQQLVLLGRKGGEGARHAQHHGIQLGQLRVGQLARVDQKVHLLQHHGVRNLCLVCLVLTHVGK